MHEALVMEGIIWNKKKKNTDWVNLFISSFLFYLLNLYITIKGSICLHFIQNSWNIIAVNILLSFNILNKIYKLLYSKVSQKIRD